MHKLYIDTIDFAHAIAHIERLAHTIDHFNSNFKKISPTSLKFNCLIVSVGISLTV